MFFYLSLPVSWGLYTNKEGQRITQNCLIVCTSDLTMAKGGLWLYPVEISEGTGPNCSLETALVFL